MPARPMVAARRFMRALKRSILRAAAVLRSRPRLAEAGTESNDAAAPGLPPGAVSASHTLAATSISWRHARSSASAARAVASNVLRAASLRKDAADART